MTGNLRRRLVGAAIMLVSGLAAGALIGPLATVVRFPFAPACPAGAPSDGCVATLPADVVDAFDDYGGEYVEGGSYDRLVFLRVPGVGDVETWMNSTDANRIGVGGDHGGRVTILMFNGEVISMTQDSTAYSKYDYTPRLAALELFGLVVLAGFVLALFRRWQDAVLPGLLGASAALLAVVALGDVLGPAWVLPVIVATHAATACAAAAHFTKRAAKPAI